MSKLKTAIVFMPSLSLLFCINTLAQNSEKPVKIKDLPPLVQKTVQEKSQGAIIKALLVETENGKTFYEMELKIKGHNKDVIIDPDGMVIAIEEEIAISSLPAVVRAGFEKHSGGGKIQEVESITKNDVIVAYEAKVKVGQKYLEIMVSKDGELITSQNDEDNDDQDEDDADKGLAKSKKL